jgi:hypothetical protein
MSTCNTITGIPKGCDNNLGGIYEAYIIDQDSISGATTVSAHTITAIPLVGGESYTPFVFKRNVGNMVISPQISLENGSTFYNHTITLVFHKREASKSNALQILAEGQRYLSIIIKDANGKYWMTEYAQLNGGDEDTGTQKSDGSKVTVTFLAEMENRAYEVNPALIPSLI